MAFRKPQALTCPDCNKTGSVTWVEGTGPQTKPGQGPAYRSLLQAGPWTVEETSRHPFWTGRLICPDCGATVLEVPDLGADNAKE